jgi:hypothetical protein
MDMMASVKKGDGAWVRRNGLDAGTAVAAYDLATGE